MDMPLLRSNSLKRFPQNPLIFTSDIGLYRPIRVWFEIWWKLLAAEENSNRKTATEKNLFNKTNFTDKKIFSPLFLIVSIA
jgi:hypothetical protein